MSETPTTDTRNLRYMKLLRAIIDHAEEESGETTRDPRAVTCYMRQQVNTIREKLAAEDEVIASLFPPIPEETTIADVAMIARQLLDCIELQGPTFGERAARAAKHGFHVTGENVHGMMCDLAELGTQIRERIAEAMADKGVAGFMKMPEDLEARVTELEAEVGKYWSRVGTENGPDAAETAAFARAARELAILRARQAAKTAKATITVVTDCCKEKKESDEPKDGNGGGCCS